MKNTLLFIMALFCFAISCTNNTKIADNKAELQDTIDYKQHIIKCTSFIDEISQVNVFSINTSEDLQRINVFFNVVEIHISNGLKSNDAETVALAGKLKEKITPLQNQFRPQIRKQFAKLVTADSDYKYHFEVAGKDNTIIYITSSNFVLSSNIEEYQQMAHGVLTQFRFKQVRYRVRQNDDTYTYYDLIVD